MISKKLQFTVVLSLALLSSSCGGSSSNNDSTSSTIETTTTSTIAPIYSIFSESIPGLSVEDCFNSTPKTTQIDCDELHDGQVIATGVYLDSNLASTTQSSLWIADAEDKCKSSFKDFVGFEYNKEKGRFAISLLLEDPEIPTITCTVINSDGKKWAGTAKNFIGSYEGVSVGDCLMFPTAIDDAIVVSCSQPHEGEMFVLDKKIGITSATAPYPTETQWDDLAYKICEDPFFAYTGADPDDEVLSYSFIYPLEEHWEDIAERTISCIATSYNGEKLSYSVRK